MLSGTTQVVLFLEPGVIHLWLHVPKAKCSVSFGGSKLTTDWHHRKAHSWSIERQLLIYNNASPNQSQEIIQKFSLKKREGLWPSMSPLLPSTHLMLTACSKWYHMPPRHSEGLLSAFLALALSVSPWCLFPTQQSQKSILITWQKTLLPLKASWFYCPPSASLYPAILTSNMQNLFLLQSLCTSILSFWNVHHPHRHIKFTFQK